MNTNENATVNTNGNTLSNTLQRWLLYGLLAAVGVAIVVLSVSILRGNAEKTAAAERIRHLPELVLADVEGKAFSLRHAAREHRRPLILVHFRTDCHYCQSEVRELRQNTELLEQALVVLVSAEPTDNLAAFRAQYGLDTLQRQNVVVLADHHNRFRTTFGTAVTPVTFVYDVSGKLVKHFQGETSAHALLNALKPSAQNP
jgi:peroxiredoxin